MRYLITLLLILPNIVFSQYEIGETYGDLKKKYPKALVNDWKKEREANPDTDEFNQDHEACIVVVQEQEGNSMNIDDKSLYITNNICTYIQYGYAKKADFLQKIRSIRYDKKWVINEWGLYESYINGLHVIMLFSDEYLFEGDSEYKVYFKVWDNF